MKKPNDRTKKTRKYQTLCKEQTTEIVFEWCKAVVRWCWCLFGRRDAVDSPVNGSFIIHRLRLHLLAITFDAGSLDRPSWMNEANPQIALRCSTRHYLLHFWHRFRATNRWNPINVHIPWMKRQFLCNQKSISRPICFSIAVAVVRKLEIFPIKLLQVN